MNEWKNLIQKIAISIHFAADNSILMIIQNSIQMHIVHSFHSYDFHNFFLMKDYYVGDSIGQWQQQQQQQNLNEWMKVIIISTTTTTTTNHLFSTTTTISDFVGPPLPDFNQTISSLSW